MTMMVMDIVFALTYEIVANCCNELACVTESSTNNSNIPKKMAKVKLQNQRTESFSKQLQ